MQSNAAARNGCGIRKEKYEKYKSKSNWKKRGTPNPMGQVVCRF